MFQRLNGTATAALHAAWRVADAVLANRMLQAASTDDLGVLVAQFAPVLRVLLLSHGPSTLGSALVWVGSGDVAAVADAVSMRGGARDKR